MATDSMQGNSAVAASVVEGAPSDTSIPEMNGATYMPSQIARRKGGLSCTECRRRKIKCDRARPCGPCTQRGSTACDWVMLEPEKRDVTRRESEDIKAEVSRNHAKLRELELSLDVANRKLLELENIIRHLTISPGSSSPSCSAPNPAPPSHMIHPTAVLPYSQSVQFVPPIIESASGQLSPDIHRSQHQQGSRHALGPQTESYPPRTYKFLPPLTNIEPLVSQPVTVVPHYSFSGSPTSEDSSTSPSTSEGGGMQ
ncbi:uncharacterized protein LAESUDRAFT_731238 [Laetiporus sulphureus 93-53]|uniref:Zn(2)-C6 fungal-type domain-containing protein n=1 Tax=Laetiporus sulphureus 93-53 TaxID=1314785 RepID=A0A165BNW1_9APHY|nr:uncharacterized protein LAESUDRAFT_731238 [Laetiporus sulphureus 93-53]KZT01386.1 hypothetical protein LAESUDRAFT_731238 [Laetiporus sulphureus 93-53]